ncbi:MAG: hypothetical protein M3406_14705 [Chloroflexota bacterium]|nr:hypothetical protein [Chloroflexota bacterium]
MGAVRLAWRLQRWELASLTAFVVAVIVALVFIGWRMEQIQASAPACFGEAHGPAGNDRGACEASFMAYSALQQIGVYPAVGATLAPFLLGVILGPPLIGREIEGRTAAMAWTLSGSRRRWLALRAGPVVALVLVASVLVGLAGTTLAGQVSRGEPAFDSLVPPLPLEVARAGLALAVGLLAGTVIGRTFPAVLATALAVSLVMAATSISIDAWMAAEARPIPQAFGMAGASKIYETGLRDDGTGEVITLAQYYGTPGVADAAELPPPGMTLVAWIIPADEYSAWMWREVAVVGIVGGAMALAFTRIALRRSP